MIKLNDLLNLLPGADVLNPDSWLSIRDHETGANYFVDADYKMTLDGEPTNTTYGDLLDREVTAIETLTNGEMDIYVR